MSEKGEKGEKKVVRRSVAIALGIACIVLAIALAVGLAATIAYYTSIIRDLEIENTNLRIVLGGRVSDLLEENTNLRKTISALEKENTNLRIIIRGLEEENAYLRDRVKDLESIVNLEKSTVWVDRQTVSQPASRYTDWTFYAPYAGYVVVQVHSSTTDNTYVRAMWSSYGVHYDQSVMVGASGAAAFPVLPGSIEIRVGNTNLLSGATETVTITYYY